MTCRLIAKILRVAQLPHRCEWCGEPINVGDRYTRIRGVFEGSPLVNKLHMECDRAAIDYCAEHDEGFVSFVNPRPESPK